jgi:hypothetical protein
MRGVMSGLFVMIGMSFNCSRGSRQDKFVYSKILEQERSYPGTANVRRDPAMSWRKLDFNLASRLAVSATSICLRFMGPEWPAGCLF